MMEPFDVAIVGAGIAGASLAAELPANWRVVLIEAEDQPGYHTTGRSNAFWQASYGGPRVEPLTTASFDFLMSPPSDFAEAGFLRQRGALNVARSSQAASVEAFIDEFKQSPVQMERVGRAALERAVPGLQPEWSEGAYEHACYDIDVAGLHAAYLRKARSRGVQLLAKARIESFHFDGNAWVLEAVGQKISARIIVNAAGAWADDVAQLAGVKPVGITPYRRTLCQVRLKEEIPSDMPLVIDIDGEIYFRPESGRLWLSPHDETPSPPCDARPEELDVALAIARLSEMTDWTVDVVEHKWAGLRSFAPDRVPVYGFDSANPNFFWCAGQGGFGIQTAPAAARLCAMLLTSGELPQSLSGISSDAYVPDRFSAAFEAN